MIPPDKDPAGRPPGGHRPSGTPEDADAMGRFLDRFADEERGDIEAAALEEDAVGLDRVESTLARAWGDEDASRPGDGGGAAPVDPTPAATDRRRSCRPEGPGPPRRGQGRRDDPRASRLWGRRALR